MVLEGQREVSVRGCLRVFWASIAVGAALLPACGGPPTTSDARTEGRGAAGAGGGADAAGGPALPPHEDDPYFPVPIPTGIAATPPMGWNSWNQFGCSNIRAELILEIADALVATGMRDAGYEFVNVDDCWLEPRRTSTGRLQPTAEFYSGSGDLTIVALSVSSCGSPPPTVAGAGGVGGEGSSRAGAAGERAGPGGASGAGGQGGAGGTGTAGAPDRPANGAAGADAGDCAQRVVALEELEPLGATVSAEGLTLVTHGSLGVDHTFGAGPARVQLIAAATLGERSWPELRLLVDDAQVGEAVVETETPTELSFAFDAAAGTHRIEIQAASGEPGLRTLADDVHSLGLKLGVYGDRGAETCAHRAGSGGFEAVDAATFAEWGIDYLKYDNCAADAATIEEDYRRMGDALPDSVVYSLCAWSFQEWGVGLGNLWRTTTDITASWDSVLANARANTLWAAYAGPGGWNDPDMLEVGVGQDLTDDEEQAHFALWAMMSAPLIAGNDLRRVGDRVRELLTNPEVIAVDQDPLGLQGYPAVNGDDLSVWVKPLAESGARAVLLLNGSTATATIRFDLGTIGLGAGLATVRDLYAHEDLTPMDDAFSTAIPAHASRLLRVQGNEPSIPHGTVHLGDLTPVYAVNGLGPVERDSNNGTSAPGDGAPIRLGGEAFERGLGVSAPAKLIYRLGENCSRLQARVGIDDATAGRGSVVFRFLGDGELLYESPRLTAEGGPDTVDLDLSGLQRLEIRVTNALDGVAWDRASIGGAELECDD